MNNTMTFEQHELERIKRMSTESLLREYSQSVRDCFGHGWPAASIVQDIRAEELISRGVTHVTNIFGDIEIRTNWREFQHNQRTAIATRCR